MGLEKFSHPQPDMGIPAVLYCYHRDGSGESIPDGDLPIAILVAKGHELQAPKPDHRGQREWMFRVSHPEKWQENDFGTQRPLPGAPTIGVWSCGGPKPTSESMLRVPNLDGDVRGIHGGLSWFRQKKALRPAGRGGVLYFLTPKCLRRGYKL
jgi:hypothetical protein